MADASMLPDGFWVRPARMDDLEAVVRVQNAQEMANFGQLISNGESLKQLWQGRNIDLQADTWVVGAQDGHIVSYASVRGRGQVRLFANVWLFPEYTGRGIGTYLLRCADARAGSWVTEAPLGARVTMGASWVSAHNQRAQRLLEHTGYEKIYSFAHMKLELDEPPAPSPVDAGIVIRAFSPGDDEQAMYAADEESAHDERGHVPETFEAWRQWHISDTILLFVAWDGSEVAGLVSGQAMGEQGYIAHLGVQPRWRRRGLGMALLRHIQGEFARRGLRMMKLNVDTLSSTGAFRLYERAGMRTCFHYYTFEKELRAGQDARF
jgi:mycothiol synthase